MAELVNASLVSIAFLSIFAISELLRKFSKLKTEHTRKFVHFSGAVTALSFPFIFQSQWTVLALSVIFVFIMYFTKKAGLLKSVHDIDRVSSGAIYHPIAVYSCFILCDTAVYMTLSI